MPNKKQWIYSPAKAQKPQVPAAEKKLIGEQFQQLIDTEFKPHYLNNPENKHRTIEDIFGKWYRSFYYLCCTYRFNITSAAAADKIHEKAIEEKFTRLEYTAEDTFNIAYMRHTGQWWEVNTGLNLKRTLEELKHNEIFHPL